MYDGLYNYYYYCGGIACVTTTKVQTQKHGLYLFRVNLFRVSNMKKIKLTFGKFKEYIFTNGSL